MKISGIKILLKSLIISSGFFTLLLVSCDSESKSFVESKENIEVIIPSIVVKNVPLNNSSQIKGKVSYSVVRKISFVNAGKLEVGDIELMAGTRFKFNELLFKLNIEQAFRILSKDKLTLASKVNALQGEIVKKIPNESVKWKKFEEGLSVKNRLPAFPNVYSEEEKAIIIEKDIFILFNKIKSQENEIEKYFYLAPFDGVVLSVSKKPNTLIRANEAVAKIAKKDVFEADFVVSKTIYSELKLYDRVEFYDGNTKVGSGKLKKAIGFNSEMKVTYSFQKEKGAMIQNNQGVRIKTKSPKINGCYLPKNAVKAGKVLVLSNRKEIKTKVKILKEQNEQIFVSGLKDGSIILLK